MQERRLSLKRHGSRVLVQELNSDGTIKKKNVVPTDYSSSLDMLLMVAALTFMAYYYYGIRAVVLVLISMVSSYIVDFICIKIRRAKYEIKDLSAILSGGILALMMPASIPFDILIIANIVTIILGKQIFGGKGKNIFSPVAVGYIFMALCFKDAVLLFPRPFETLELLPTVENTLFQSLSHTLNIASNPAISGIDIMLGKFIGPMGGTHTIVMLVCAAALIARRSISGVTVISALGIVMLFACLFPKYGNSIPTSISYELVSGLLIFGLTFLASSQDMVPRERFARVVYGVIIGILIVIFRRLATVENSVVFAIIIASPFRVALDLSEHLLSNCLRLLAGIFKAIFVILIKILLLLKLGLVSLVKLIRNCIAFANACNKKEITETDDADDADETKESIETDDADETKESIETDDADKTKEVSETDDVDKTKENSEANADRGDESTDTTKDYTTEVDGDEKIYGSDTIKR